MFSCYFRARRGLQAYGHMSINDASPGVKALTPDWSAPATWHANSRSKGGPIRVHGLKWEKYYLGSLFKLKLMIMSAYLMNSSPFAEPKFPPNEEYSHSNYMANSSAEDYYRHGPANFMFSSEQRMYSAQEGFHPSATHPANCGTFGSGPPGLGRVPDPGNHLGGSGYGPSQNPPTVPSPTHSQTLPCNQTTTTPPVIYPWMKKVHMGSGKSHFHRSLSEKKTFYNPPKSFQNA